MKLLIAEDDLTSRTMLQVLLTKWGYEVLGTADGQEAFDALQDKDAPQLAILDWMMPGLDGLELCRKLRDQQRDRSLYLILLTIKGETDDIVKGLGAGADDYVAKPYNHAELRARVDAGRRIIMMQNETRQCNKLQGALEMAGAVCHELNQPLQSVFGYAELLELDLEADDPNSEAIQTIREGVERIRTLTRKLMKVTRYRSKPYLNRNIIDIEEAVVKPEERDWYE